MSISSAITIDGVTSRSGREFIGSDNGSKVSRLDPPISSLATSCHIKSVVKSEVRSTEGSATWIISGFSKLEDKTGFCLFSPEFTMAGIWYRLQVFPSGGGRKDSASSEGIPQPISFSFYHAFPEV